jgi:hypothetical protein
MPLKGDHSDRLSIGGNGLHARASSASLVELDQSMAVR